MAHSMDSKTLNMSFKDFEAEILLLWASAASRTSWTDAPTRKAMQELCERLRYAVEQQCPYVTVEDKFSDFS